MLKRDPVHQLVYYQTEIGTYASTSKVGTRIARALDGAFAWYLEDRVVSPA